LGHLATEAQTLEDDDDVFRLLLWQTGARNARPLDSPPLRGPG